MRIGRQGSSCCASESLWRPSSSSRKRHSARAGAGDGADSRGRLLDGPDTAVADGRNRLAGARSSRRSAGPPRHPARVSIDMHEVTNGDVRGARREEGRRAAVALGGRDTTGWQRATAGLQRQLARGGEVLRGPGQAAADRSGMGEAPHAAASTISIIRGATTTPRNPEAEGARPASARTADSASGPLPVGSFAANAVRPLRHVRQRVGVGRGLVRPELLQREPDGEPERSRPSVSTR